MIESDEIHSWELTAHGYEESYYRCSCCKLSVRENWDGPDKPINGCTVEGRFQ